MALGRSNYEQLGEKTVNGRQLMLLLAMQHLEQFKCLGGLLAEAYAASTWRLLDAEPPSLLTPPLSLPVEPQMCSEGCKHFNATSQEPGYPWACSAASTSAAI